MQLLIYHRVSKMLLALGVSNRYVEWDARSLLRKRYWFKIIDFLTMWYVAYFLAKMLRLMKRFLALCMFVIFKGKPWISWTFKDPTEITLQMNSRCQDSKQFGCDLVIDIFILQRMVATSQGIQKQVLKINEVFISGL